MNTFNNSPSTSRLSPLPRKLPAVPLESRRISRPLPTIPRALICKKCSTCITSHNVLLPLSSIPSDSRSFKGFSGKASLFTETYNVTLAKAGVQLMATGAHTMQEITCGTCSSYLGWKIVRAHEKSESWKDGHCLLELENLLVQSESTAPLNISSNHRRTSSGSETDISY
ncbi:hypothetical protein B0H34DRAFT_746758 [Crassisporium funariophilum]|nr:hypothetical protein B0H34DRAFT_746758 [Crassisporium funariophilum]